MLVLRDLAKRFGGIDAVAGVTCTFPERTVTGLIGPNGAGKTTIFNMITGLAAPSAGQVILEDHDITGWRPHRVARLGIGRTFQHTRIFSDMSVLENVMLAFPEVTASLPRALGFGPAERARLEAAAMEKLELLALGDVARRRASELSYGDQKVAMLACLLASGARMLLLDEPTGGIDPSARGRVLAGIATLGERGHTIVVIEHNLDVVRSTCGRVVFLAEGRVIAEGTPSEVEADPRLTRLYFGDADA